jgi:Cu(I)-responsive transcriptional regulator
MKISEVAQKTGLSTKAIRYYESQGLIESERLSNGYRDYAQAQLDALSFVAHARELGFSVEACADLLQLRANPKRASKQVKRVAQSRLEAIRDQRQRLDEMEALLLTMIEQCPGDENSHCAIINALEGDKLD